MAFFAALMHARLKGVGGVVCFKPCMFFFQSFHDLHIANLYEELLKEV